MSEIPEHIRAMTRRDVLRGVRDGIFKCRRLDGSEFMFPPADRLPRALPLKAIVKRSQRLKARMHTYAEQDAHCFYCNRAQHFDVWTLDHKIPVSRSGKGGANIVGACYICNQQKGCLTLDEFMEFRHDPKLLKEKRTEIQLAIEKAR